VERTLLLHQAFLRPQDSKVQEKEIVCGCNLLHSPARPLDIYSIHYKLLLITLRYHQQALVSLSRFFPLTANLLHLSGRIAMAIQKITHLTTPSIILLTIIMTTYGITLMTIFVITLGITRMMTNGTTLMI